jgi:inorganic pyrophosphatase
MKTKLPKPFSGNKDNIHVVIESPFKSRNKFDYDEVSGLYKLSKVMPSGLTFPCDMGFIPGTKGDDKDPLDAIILMDELTFPGCFVECRVVGVLKLFQANGKKEIRNDRFVTVPAAMEEMNEILTIDHLNEHRISAITHFFKSYNLFKKKKVRLIETGGPQEAIKLIKKQCS